MELQGHLETARSGAKNSSSAADSPLDEAHFSLIRQAVRGRKRIDSAARTARSSSIVTLVIGGLGVAAGLIWWSWLGMLTCLGVLAVGAVEFVGYLRMRQARPGAERLLGANQLAFLGIITIYCLIQILAFSTDRAKDGLLTEEARSQLAMMPDLQEGIEKSIDRWAPILTYGMYSVIIVLSICFQGGLALYYFTRKKYVESFNRDTPLWIIRLLGEVRR